MQRGWGMLKFAATGLAWLAGLALLHRCERLPTAAEYGALLAAGLLLLLLRRRHWLALAGCVAVLAFAQGAQRAQWRMTPALSPAWEGRDLVLSGRVDSLPIAITGQGGVPGWRFEFAVDGVGPTGTALPPEVPRRLMLLVYSGPQGRAAPAPPAERGKQAWGGSAPAWDAPPITAGERWRFTARLKRAHGLANPGGFDAELWLFEQGLRASGVVRASQRLAAAPWWEIDAARQRLRTAIRERVADPGMAGLLAALSLGDQNAIVVAVNKPASILPREKPFRTERV